MEQSATPWRVFDAPSNGDAGSGTDAPQLPTANPAARVRSAPSTKVAIAGVAGAVVIGVVAVAVALSGSGGQVVEAPDRSFGAAPNRNAMLAGGAEVVIDVTGAVTKPGVYHLAVGSRVGDAIDAAGGFSPRVDAEKVASAINLAATLTDGLQVHVPSRDDPSSTPGTGGGASGAGSGASRATNLNTATQSELEALPGIGPVTAAKIIESRSATPFTSVEQLRERKLVGEKTFDQLKSLVTVG